jgi:SWI/SNF-related matrix-associated actin-dependent regulator 1 of chromatin subfamily A
MLSTRSKPKELKKAYEDHEEGKKEVHIMTVKAENALIKVRDTVEYVLDLAVQGEKVVIYTDHREPCKEIAEKLTSKKLRVGMIRGGVPPFTRQKAVDDFQNGLLDALVCTISAASTGITLTKAKNLVFNDYSWSYVDMIQAMKRIHRIGQGETCVVHYMLSSDIDQMIKKKVLKKEEILGKVL